MNIELPINTDNTMIPMITEGAFKCTKCEGAVVIYDVDSRIISDAMNPDLLKAFRIRVVTMCTECGQRDVYRVGIGVTLFHSAQFSEEAQEKLDKADRMVAAMEKNGRISTSDQKVDKAKYDACPLWGNLKRRIEENSTRRRCND